MEAKEYQAYVETTTTERVRDLNMTYAALGLAGETGEAVDIIKKAIRDGRFLKKNEINDLLLELGDILWYVSRLLSIHGLTLSDAFEANKEKLDSRKANKERQFANV